MTSTTRPAGVGDSPRPPGPGSPGIPGGPATPRLGAPGGPGSSGSSGSAGFAGRDNVAIATGLLAGLAGVLHLAAAWAHRDHSALVALFVAVAVVQIGWGLAMVLRRRAPTWLVVAGAVVNAMAVGFYGLTRVTGLGDVSGLEEVQPVGFADLVVVALEVAAVAGAAVLLWPGLLPRRWRDAPLGRTGLAAVAACSLLLAGPAMVAGASHEHDHDHAGHEHGGHEHAAGEGHDHSRGSGSGHGHADGKHAGDHDADGHGHGAGQSHDDGLGHAHGTGGRHGRSAGHDDGHDHPGGHDDPPGHPPGDHHEDPPGHGHEDPPGGHEDPPGHGHEDPPGHGDPPDDHFPDDWTPDQVAYAQRLIQRTEEALPALADPAAREAAGFEPFGDLAPGGYTHWINWGWIDDGRVLDPSHPESVMVQSTASGERLVAAMYFLPSEYPDVPSIPATYAWLPGWHLHDNICAADRRFTGLAFNGQCSSGELLQTPPMMHVWAVDTPCGRFAGVDETGLACGSHEH